MICIYWLLKVHFIFYSNTSMCLVRVHIGYTEHNHRRTGDFLWCYVRVHISHANWKIISPFTKICGKCFQKFQTGFSLKKQTNKHHFYATHIPKNIFCNLNDVSGDSVNYQVLPTTIQNESSQRIDYQNFNDPGISKPGGQSFV